ncbi:MAG: hypothetical protein V2A65_08025 [Candidatus Omnitrophota bacterium]
MSMGQIVMTAGVNNLVADNDSFAKFVCQSLRRHCHNDWGELGQEDKTANDQALKDGDRLFSAYKSEGQPKVWIITEADRSATTVLFPEEY